MQPNLKTCSTRRHVGSGNSEGRSRVSLWIRLKRFSETLAAVKRSRNNCHLQVPVAILHVLKETWKFIQRDLSHDEIGRADVTPCDCIECLANKTGRMMESGSNCDFRVVEEGGVQLHRA